MTTFFVCKTVTAYPNKSRFLALQRSFDSLKEVAAALRDSGSNLPQDVYIKNETPSDIVWYRRPGDKAEGDEVVELQRLSRDEVRELARLLRK